MNKDYREMSSNPMEWLEMSKELRYSSDILWDKLGELEKTSEFKERVFESIALIRSSTALITYALENAIKGLIIKSNPVVIKNNQIKFSEIGINDSHDLNALYNHTNVEKYDSDVELLNRLKEFGIWAGRYRLPKNENRYIETKEKITSGDMDMKSARNILDNLEKEYEKA